MVVNDFKNPLLSEATCSSLLQKLKIIWDEVGESDDERDKMLLQIQQECIEVYWRKVDLANKSKGQLLQTLADAKIEFSNLLSSLGEKSFSGITDDTNGTIKEQLAAVGPALGQLWKLKDERITEFYNVQSQIQKITREITGSLNSKEQEPVVDETNLSLKKLDEYNAQLQELQKEKSERLHKVMQFVSSVHDLCGVLGMNFLNTLTKVHPSLNDSSGVKCKSISDETLSGLAKTVSALKEDKMERLQKLQELASQLIDLWNLMDTPEDERSLFVHVTCNISATVDEVTAPGALALDLIEQLEVEVERLDQLKGIKMKEIALKRQAELEDIYASAHVEIDQEAARDKILSMIESGNVEPSDLLADMDNQIMIAKEEALSRRDILGKVEKWMSAREEESWLDDYDQDDNRYSASRGAHLNLRRAERARILINKIPSLVDSLEAKTRAWEKAHDITFTYDGVPLLAMLDEYSILRQHREEEKRRMRVSPAGTAPTKKAAATGVQRLSVGNVTTTSGRGGANGSASKRLSLNQNESRSKA